MKIAFDFDGVFIEENFEYIKKLINKFDKAYIITSRNDTKDNREEIENLLKKKSININGDIILASGYINKVAAIARTNPDMFIDDDMAIIRLISDNCKDVICVHSDNIKTIINLLRR